MKMVVAEREIDRVGVSSNRSFGMKPTGKAFWILSSGLYKDKIRAIIREYSCNARDAHVLNGNEATPFNVHLPNHLEPFFRVRDFGPGLSDADVMTVFATYFESLKDTDDRFTGCLGLGSKSAFSYVDSFTVVSRHAGVKTTYAAYMDEAKCPNICMIGVPEICAEPSGLEVTVPVDHSRDFHSFMRTARSVLAHFDPEPVVEGAADFTFERPAVRISGDGYRILDRHDGFPTAVMGSIAYPIDVNSLGAIEHDLRYFLQQSALEMDFPLGALDFTAGREELSYDPPVIKAVVERARMVLTDMCERAVEPFETCETIWDALCTYDDLRNNFPMWGSLDVARFQWRGIPVRTNTVSIPLEQDFKRLAVLCFSGSSQSPNSYSTWAMPTAKSFVVNVSRNTVLLFDDLKRGAVTRIRHHRRTNGINNQTVILFRGDQDDLVTLEMLLGHLLAPVSSLPEPPAVKRRIRLRELTPDARARTSMVGAKKNWRISDVDPLAIDPPFYVATRSSVVFDGDREAREFDGVFDRACSMGLIDRKTVAFYQVPKTLMSSIDDLQWTEFFGWIRAALAKIILSENIAKTTEMMSMYRTFKSNHRTSKDHIDSLRTAVEGMKFSSDHPVKVFLKLHDECRDVNLNRVVQIEELASLVDLEIPKSGDFDGKDLSELFTEVLGRYPMLNYPMTNPYCLNSRDITRMREYIQSKEVA